MPSIQLPNVRVHYEFAGAPAAPVLLLSHSLGVNLSMWEPQVAEFSKYFHVLRYDTRGHGSSSTPPGDYSIAMLGQDVVHLLDALHLKKVHFCGISMGGMIGMWLALQAPEYLNKIVLSNTAAKIGTPATWGARIDTVRANGMLAVAPAIIERWFTFNFRAKSPDSVAWIQSMLEAADPHGYVACCAAIRDMDFTENLSAIRSPTLIITGTHDPGTTPADGIYLAENIPGAGRVELNASHLSNVEAAEEFTAAALHFLLQD